MKINIEKLKENVKKYNNLLELYENNCENFYYEAEFNTKYWKSVIANYFFSLIEVEKKENRIFFEELNLLKSVFNYLVENYQSFGKKISLDLDSKDVIINKLNNYKTGDLAILLNDDYLDLININKSRDNIKNIEKNILKYKNKYKKTCNSIEIIEDEIKIKLSEIVISSVEEYDSVIREKGTVDHLLIDINNLENSIKKLEMYYKEECEIIEDLKLVFENIKCNYVTKNLDILDNLMLDILIKYKKILTNHFNNIKLLNDNIEKSKTVSIHSKVIIEKSSGVNL